MMKHRALVALGLICAILLSACASTSGKEVSEDSVAKIQKGKTTYSEVIDILGEPNAKKTTKDGTILVYSHSEARSDLLSYIPYSYGLLGTTKSEYKNVNIFLDKNNVVQEVQLEEGSSEGGTTF